MIVTLEGKISEKIGDLVVVECNGVGYGVQVSFEDLNLLTIGEHAKIYIYENIRESGYDLFGFTSPETKKLFELLLTVKGIGPKIAIAVLNVANPSQVRQSIAGGDVKFIAQANGVGRKAAERIVVDLKDKVGLAASEDAIDFLTASANPDDEALQGLMALGYSLQDAAEALKKVDKKLPAEDRIKAALKQ